MSQAKIFLPQEKISSLRVNSWVKQASLNLHLYEGSGPQDNLLPCDFLPRFTADLCVSTFLWCGPSKYFPRSPTTAVLSGMLDFQPGPQNPRVFFLPSPWKLVATEASLKGCSSRIYNSLTIQGTWSPQTLMLPVNILELRAIRLTLLHGHPVRMHSGNGLWPT